MILADPTYIYAAQADPGAYDPQAVAAGINSAQQAQMEGKHRKIKKRMKGAYEW